MTTTVPHHSVCGVCGGISEQTGLQSTNAFGSPDLDLRPPEMERSTMCYWVQTCPQCGYCASDIAEKLQRSSGLLNDYPSSRPRTAPSIGWMKSHEINFL